jgi:DNA-binding NarL/FixJ family response regulator
VKRDQVLIVSSHPLFAEAITRLLTEAGVHVAGRVDNVDQAVPMLTSQPIKSIIVDHDDPQLRDADVVSQLLGNETAQNVIFLTLAGNQMIVHHRERVKNITPQDLVRAVGLAEAD